MSDDVVGTAAAPPDDCLDGIVDFDQLLGLFQMLLLKCELMLHHRIMISMSPRHVAFVVRAPH